LEIQLINDKYLIWETNAESKEKVLGEFNSKLNMINTKWVIKRKRRRKKLNIIVNLIEAFQKENRWNFKEIAVFNLLNKDNLEKMYLWLKFIRIRKKERFKLKEFLIGRKVVGIVE
jgi:hypothetical protein